MLLLSFLKITDGFFLIVANTKLINRHAQKEFLFFFFFSTVKAQYGFCCSYVLINSAKQLWSIVSVI